MPNLNQLPRLIPERCASVAALRAKFPDLPAVALSIRQPWSFFIVHGFKTVENRAWRTHLRGPVLIHAGCKFYDLDSETETFIGKAIRRPFPRDLTEEHAPLGGIVGVAEIVDCVESSSSPWFVGPFGFVLKNARPLPFTPCAGKLGFFRV